MKVKVCRPNAGHRADTKFKILLRNSASSLFLYQFLKNLLDIANGPMTSLILENRF